MQQFTLGDLNCNYNAQMYPGAANTPSPYLVPPTISHTFFADRSSSTIRGQNLWANDLWAENSYPSSQHSVSLSPAEPPLITTLPQPHMTLPWPNATSSSVQPIAIPSTSARNPVSKIRPIERAVANWVKGSKKQGVLVTDSAIKEKAQHFLSTVGKEGDFLLINSPGWLEQFKQRIGITPSPNALPSPSPPPATSGQAEFKTSGPKNHGGSGEDSGNAPLESVSCVGNLGK